MTKGATSLCKIIEFLLIAGMVLLLIGCAAKTDNNDETGADATIKVGRNVISIKNDLNVEALSDWQNGLENPIIANYYEKDINDVLDYYGTPQTKVYYLEYDFNEDGQNDYFVALASPFYSGTAGTPNEILISDGQMLTPVGLPMMHAYSINSEMPKCTIYVIKDSNHYKWNDLIFSAEYYTRYLMCELEVNPKSTLIVRDSSDNIIGINTHDAGDGGVTVGYGHYVGRNEVEDRADLLARYNIDASIGGLRNMVNIDAVNEILAEDINLNAQAINKFLSSNSIHLTQQQFDALVIFRFNAGSLSESVQRVLIEGDFTYEKIYNALIGRYKSDGEHDVGWENRTRTTVNLFINGNYSKGY